MARIILDTRALLEFLSGNEAVVEKVKQYVGKEELCITSLTYFEVSLVVKNEFLKEEIADSFIVLDITKEVAEKAKEIYEYIEEIRKPSIKAVITAAASIIYRGFLIPGNKREYVDMPEIKMI